jgi:hypothetical protein
VDSVGTNCLQLFTNTTIENYSSESAVLIETKNALDKYPIVIYYDFNSSKRKDEKHILNRGESTSRERTGRHLIQLQEAAFSFLGSNILRMQPVFVPAHLLQDT